jgi:homoserine O-succinyltransferase
MPLVAYSSLPAFESMRREGKAVVEPNQATDTGLPEIRIGFLNLMPDAALRATDRQFMRLVSAYEDSANIWFRPFCVAAEARGQDAQQHINKYYDTFEKVSEDGVDALIITGANPKYVDLEEEAFWQPLTQVLRWADESVQSTMCSCLATHAVLKYRDLTERVRLPQKRWGVYKHRILLPDHLLLKDVEPPVDAPHSHHFDVSEEEMNSIGVPVLAVSDEAGVHMAVSPDGFSYVFFQGHPEYDGISLLKEYRREVVRYAAGERDDYPPYPEHYFDEDALALLTDYRSRLLEAMASNSEPPIFPEAEVTRGRERTWAEAGQTIYRNWLAKVASQLQKSLT